MEKLRDLLPFLADGICRIKGRPHETGGRRGISRQPDAAHPLPVGAEGQLRREAILRLRGRERHKIVQAGHMIGKRRIVGEDARAVFVHAHPLLRRLGDIAAIPVRRHPVQRREREPFAERLRHEMHAAQKFRRLRRGRTRPEYPRDEFVRREVVRARFGCGEVMRVARKIQPRHAHALFVARIGKERYAALEARRARHGVMPRLRGRKGKAERERARHAHRLFPEAVFEVEISSEIKFSALRERDAGTHDPDPPFRTVCAAARKISGAPQVRAAPAFSYFSSAGNEHIDLPREHVHGNFARNPLFAVKIPDDPFARLYLEMRTFQPLDLPLLNAVPEQE